MNIQLVAVSIVAQRISNADLSSIESCRATVVSVGDCDVGDFVVCSEVHSPPGSIVMPCVRTGVLVPVACTIPINSILRLSVAIVCRGLCSNSTFCHIWTLKEAWKTRMKERCPTLNCGYVHWKIRVCYYILSRHFLNIIKKSLPGIEVVKFTRNSNPGTYTTYGERAVLPAFPFVSGVTPWSLHIVWVTAVVVVFQATDKST